MSHAAGEEKKGLKIREYLVQSRSRAFQTGRDADSDYQTIQVPASV